MSNFIDQVNTTARSLRDDNSEWKPNRVLGVGPSRGFFFLSTEVVRGEPTDGFHRHERPLQAKVYDVDGSRFNEYTGFWCANRPFRVS